MNTRRVLASFLAVSLTSSSAATPSWAAAAAPASSIGVAAAVKGLVKAFPALAPESVGRVIQSGKPLYLNEHVTTGPGGHLQIMLKDETVFTIGPDSDIVLDEFVYNPETDAGKVTASVSKGVFRFITGNIGKKDPSRMEVKLPAGTIGIRGTIVAGQVHKDGTSMAVLLGPGPATVPGARVGAFNLSNAHGSVFVEKPGFGSTLRGDTLPPTQPALVPVSQMRALLGDLTPKTIAQRAEDGKQMLAERLAQKVSGDGPDASERKLAEKLMAGEPLSPEEQAQVRRRMDGEKMSQTEMHLAGKMLAGENLTPEEQQKLVMMTAGEQLMERMGGAENMTPEQRQLAEKMMTGALSPEQQRQMMQKLSPEDRAMMGGVLPPKMDAGYRFEGGDPNAMLLGGYVKLDPMLSPYGGIDTYMGTPEFFNTYDPNRDANFIGEDALKTGTFADGPTTWEFIRSQIVTGTGYYPGKSGGFQMNTCGGGPCANPTAGNTWGFGNMTVDFGARKITGTAYITAAPGGVVPNINDTASISVDFGAMLGGAVIGVVGSTGKSDYKFAIVNANGLPAEMLVGRASYNDFTAADVHGVGEELRSIKIDGAP